MSLQLRLSYIVGDRVYCDHPYDGNIRIVGETGTVIGADDGKVTVEFDRNVSGHSNSDGRSGHCWCFYHDTPLSYRCLHYLAPIGPPAPPRVNPNSIEAMMEASATLCRD